MLGPVFEGVSNKLGDKAKFFKVDIDESGNIAQKYRISAVPTMIIFKDGVPVENLAGFMPEQNITNKVNAHIDESLELIFDPIVKNIISELE